MNKTKLFLLISLFFAAVSPSHSQSINGLLGMNFSKMTFKDDSGTYNDNIKFRPGFQFGLTATMPLTQQFAIEGGLLVSQKGFNQKETGTDSIFGDYEVNLKMTPVYLEIPLYGKVYFPFGDESKLFIQAGPYLGLGIGGKLKTKVEIMGLSDESNESLKWGTGDEDDLRPLDIGYLAGAGVEIQKFMIGARYSGSLTNVASVSDNGTMVKNMVIGIYAAYKIFEMEQKRGNHRRH